MSEKSDVKVPEEIRKGWEEARLCANLIREGKAKIMIATRKDGIHVPIHEAKVRRCSMVLREEMYFEPRTISPAGNIRWFGEIYTAPQMLCHIEQTVYIRDNGRMLFIYELDSDKLSEEEKIEAVFTLICKIEKTDKGHRYGRKIT